MEYLQCGEPIPRGCGGVSGNTAAEGNEWLTLASAMKSSRAATLPACSTQRNSSAVPKW
jgi:hypothetical protein